MWTKLKAKRGLLAALGLCLAGLLLFLIGSCAAPKVRPHAGDGTFQDKSWRWPWGNVGMPVPGYTIDFPEFDLAAPFAAEYRLEDLPKLNAEVGIYLSIRDPGRVLQSDDQRRSLAAAVRFEVIDDDGHVVTQLDQSLAKLRWASPEGADYGLYDLNHSFFAARTEGQYRLRVQYLPDPKLSGFRGFVHIRCGGSI
jgi:hypothetical protein